MHGKKRVVADGPMKRVVTDGPMSVMSLSRHMMPVRRLSLTDFRIKIGRGARDKTLKAGVAQDETMKRDGVGEKARGEEGSRTSSGRSRQVRSVHTVYIREVRCSARAAPRRRAKVAAAGARRQRYWRLDSRTYAASYCSTGLVEASAGRDAFWASSPRSDLVVRHIAGMTERGKQGLEYI